MPATARYQGHGTNQFFLLRFADSHDINLDTQNLEALREWLAPRQIPELNFYLYYFANFSIHLFLLYPSSFIQVRPPPTITFPS